jgi:glycosyltransferase involved in cell wall biosynthesis
MENGVAVSIVMAVHNNQQTVSETLQSVVSQSFDGWELVIVDDASTDSTPEILRAWAKREPRIQLLTNSTNLGLAASLNRGWQAARYPYVARIDGDDLMHPDRLRLQTQFLNANPEIDVLGTAVELIDQWGETIGMGEAKNEHEDIVGGIFRETPFFHPSVMMRKQFLELNAGYDTSLRRAQDRDLWLRGRHLAKYHNLDQPLTKYRVRRGTSWGDVIYGTQVLLRTIHRERLATTQYYYAARFFVACLLGHLGVRRVGLGS